MSEENSFWNAINFNDDGLIPVIAQAASSGEVLMLAWMNREAIEQTLETGQMHYWSRSRGKQWRKGETSGHTQAVKELILDCDGDTLLAKVEQTGVACHTGRPNCFFNKEEGGAWVITQEVEVDPETAYGNKE